MNSQINKMLSSQKEIQFYIIKSLETRQGIGIVVRQVYHHAPEYILCLLLSDEHFSFSFSSSYYYYYF